MDDFEYAILDTEAGRLLPHRFIDREKAEQHIDGERFVLVFKPNEWKLA